MVWFSIIRCDLGVSLVLLVRIVDHPHKLYELARTPQLSPRQISAENNPQRISMPQLKPSQVSAISKMKRVPLPISGKGTLTPRDFHCRASNPSFYVATTTWSLQLGKRNWRLIIGWFCFLLQQSSHWRLAGFSRQADTSSEAPPGTRLIPLPLSVPAGF